MSIINTVEDLYKQIIQIEEVCEESFIDLGLFPYSSFDEDSFIEWVMANKPLTYERTMRALAQKKRKLYRLETNELVEAFASKIELPLPANKEIDISSEYPLVEGTEYEDWYRTIELLSEFCFYDNQCLQEMISFRILPYL